MKKPKTSKAHMKELKEVFSDYPRIIKSLEEKLRKNKEVLIDFVQIHGDNITIGSPLYLMGPTYWYGIYTKNKQGEEKQLTRICDYIGIGDKIRKKGFV